jgi:DNA-binding XRE family transcriptional regulator
MRLTELIRNARKESAMSQEQLANLLGISLEALQELEDEDEDAWESKTERIVYGDNLETQIYHLDSGDYREVDCPSCGNVHQIHFTRKGDGNLRCPSIFIRIEEDCE